MSVQKKEKKRTHPEVNSPIQPTGVFLDENDLQELSLRYMAAQFDPQRKKFANGALSFSRSFVVEKNIAQTLINPLVAAGRARVVDRIPRSSYPGSGNTVVYLNDDESVQQSLKNVSENILQHVTRFYFAHPNEVSSTHIFPNTSTSGLKGLSIDLKPSKELGQAITDMQWSMGRGLRVIALPDHFDAEAFIDANEPILAHAFRVGVGMGGAVKAIQFFYDENHRVYMTIAAGPDRKQKRSINETIAGIRKPSNLLAIMNDVRELGIQARETVAQVMLECIPWQGSGIEQVLDSPYVFVDTDMMTAFSGGVVGDLGELSPFSVGLDKLLIHQPEKNLIFPLGTKISKNGISGIALPQGATQKKIESLVGLMPKTGVESGLKNVTTLKSLATGFHEKMIIQK